MRQICITTKVALIKSRALCFKIETRFSKSLTAWQCKTNNNRHVYIHISWIGKKYFVNVPVMIILWALFSVKSMAAHAVFFTLAADGSSLTDTYSPPLSYCKFCTSHSSTSNTCSRIAAWSPWRGSCSHAHNTLIDSRPAPDHPSCILCGKMTTVFDIIITVTS